MSLLSKINEEIKIAMKSKDTLKLESLRAIKTAIILYQTSKGASDNPSYEVHLSFLRKDVTILLIMNMLKLRLYLLFYPNNFQMTKLKNIFLR